MTVAAAQMVAAGMITQEQESSDIGGLKTQPDGKEQLKNRSDAQVTVAMPRSLSSGRCTCSYNCS
jgi:hypothetical protein